MNYPTLISLIFVVVAFSSKLLAQPGPGQPPPSNTLNPDNDSIRISAHFWTSIYGTIDENLQIQDTVKLYAGDLTKSSSADPNATIAIRKWTLWGNLEGETSFCFLQTIFDYGEQAVFTCPLPGSYIAFVKDDTINKDTVDKHLPPDQIGSADNVQKIWESRSRLATYELSGRYDANTGWYENFTTTLKELWLKSARVTISDPFEITYSDFCYLWNFRTKEIARVGYISREPEPATGVNQINSYIIIELSVWVVEAGGIGENERVNKRENMVVSDYSRILTSKFRAKGLEPCLRQVHPSVELASGVNFHETEEDFMTPHWKMTIKIHTDRIVATLKDVQFLVSSRQHISLFNCFVGNTLVFINTQTYDFVTKGQFDRTAINWDASVIPNTSVEFLKLKVRQLYGHPTVYVGQRFGRDFQPGNLRTDMVVVDNPCVAQELAIAAAGRIYVGENLLTDKTRNKLDVILPGLWGTSGLDPVDEQRKSQEFFEIVDMAFTPTHVVFLMDDSSIFFHSHSAYYKGLAYVTSTKEHRLGSLVKRRWCARTGTPKQSNMVVPAYSSIGDIISIQIYPVEGSINVWNQDFSTACLGKDSANFFMKTEADIRSEINETCIHQDEAVDRSNERGLSERINLDGCKQKQNTKQSDAGTESYALWNNEKRLPQFDPHFPKELTNAALYKTDSNVSLYNHVITFYLDYSVGGPRRLESLLTQNGLTLIDANKLHSVEFTSVENQFIVGVEFKSQEFYETSNNKYDFTLVITTMGASQMPSRIYPLSERVEKLKPTFAFAGAVIARTTPYMMKNMVGNATTGIAYGTKLFPINTAIPAYVIDFGDVFIFSSVDTKYARPLSFFSRDYIHQKLRNIKLKNDGDPAIINQLEDDQRSPIFSTTSSLCTSRDCPTPSEDLFDLLVTEHGTVSILKRRKIGGTVQEGQSVCIGSVMTLSSLREVKPFVTQDKIFQMVSPEGHIMYGGYKTKGFPLYEVCDPSDVTKLNRTCLVAHDDNNFDPYCVILPTVAQGSCTPWEFVNETKSGDPAKNENKVGFCATVSDKACLFKPPHDPSGFPPDNAPNMQVESARTLGIPFYSILYGNLELVPEEKLSAVSSTDKSLTENRLCPFASFEVDYEKFDYAEVGFHIRMTATISYLGKNIPSEADLIVEFENIAGIQVQITASIVEEKDQTTLSKSIDIKVRLTDSILKKMITKKMISNFREKRNLGKENMHAFSITIRPSVVSLRCQKENFFVTIHYNTGCNPFTRIRFLAEASPVYRRPKPIVKENGTDMESRGGKTWYREGDDLIVPRGDVWFKQRETFKCGNKEAEKCKIPYAYLYGDNIYDLSWRDPFVPQFEQIMQPHSRRVSANVILYDLLGFNVVMNISSLKAGCYHTAGSWYNDLVGSTANIGIDATEQEDVYQYFVDCFDQSVLPRDKPLVLESAGAEYRLINLTNHNRVRFDIQKKGIGRTKNRNQVLIFRAVVINTDLNRFTHCKLMDTFFLIRIVGIQPPRKGLAYWKYAVIVFTLLLALAIVYLIFSLSFTWKLDASMPMHVGDHPDDNNAEEKEDKSRKAARELQEKQRVESDALKLQMFAKFRERKMQRTKK